MSINIGLLTTSALGFTVALSWNNAIQNIIHRYFASDKFHTSIIYAVAVTLFVIFMATIINISRKLIWNHDKLTNCGSNTSLVKLWEPPINYVC